MPRRRPRTTPFLPHLADDSPASSPIAATELVSYLQRSGETVVAPDGLRFVRTAVLPGCRYWLWAVATGAGHGWALVMEDAEGAWMAWRRGAGLAPEAVLLADYEDVFGAPPVVDARPEVRPSA